MIPSAHRRHPGRRYGAGRLEHHEIHPQVTGSQPYQTEWRSDRCTQEEYRQDPFCHTRR